MTREDLFLGCAAVAMMVITVVVKFWDPFWWLRWY